MASPFESVEDSPFLRAQLRSLDEGVDELRERTARLSKGCSAYRDGLEDAYANEVNFAESVRAFHGPLDDPFGAQVGASEIDRLLGAFRDIADARGALLSAVETDLCARLETMVSVDLRDATEAKRRFERCSAEHERARAHFLKLTKDAKPETLRLAEAEMTQARREHDAARFGLMSRLHEADSRKRVAFVRQIAVAVDAHRAFFERGFRALAELEPFVRQVVKRCDAEAEACADDARRLVDAMAAHTAARESETARGVFVKTPGGRAEKAAPQTSLASDRSRAIQTAMHAAETAARFDRTRGGSLGGDEDALGDAPGGGSSRRDADRADDESSASASASAPARAEGVALPGAPFLAQGYLLKRSSSMRADWKRRFFVLDAFGHLGYYRDADVGSLSLRESGEPGPGGSLSRAKDTVSLLTATIKPDLEDAPAMRFCFRVVSPGKTYCLQAESEADRALDGGHHRRGGGPAQQRHRHRAERLLDRVAAAFARVEPRSLARGVLLGGVRVREKPPANGERGERRRPRHQLRAGLAGFLRKNDAFGVSVDRRAPERRAPDVSARDGGRSGRRKRRDSDSFSGARGGDGIKKKRRRPARRLGARACAARERGVRGLRRCGARMGEPEPRRDALHRVRRRAQTDGHARLQGALVRSGRARLGTRRARARLRGLGEHERQRAVGGEARGRGGRRGEHRRRNRGERAFRSERETRPKLTSRREDGVRQGEVAGPAVVRRWLARRGSR